MAGVHAQNAKRFAGILEGAAKDPHVPVSHTVGENSSSHSESESSSVLVENMPSKSWASEFSAATMPRRKARPAQATNHEQLTAKAVTRESLSGPPGQAAYADHVARPGAEDPMVPRSRAGGEDHH